MEMMFTNWRGMSRNTFLASPLINTVILPGPPYHVLPVRRRQ